MDNLSYLNQISATTPHSTHTTPPLFSKKMKIFLIISGAVLLISIILGIALGSGRSDPSADLSRLSLRLENLNTAISTYQPSVKSTSLRASSSTLHTVLEGLSVAIATDKKPSASLVAEESAHLARLDSSLKNAKLTATLDRVYAYEFSYEIQLLLALLSDLYPSVTSPTTQSALESAYNSLTTLLPSFES